VVEREWMLGVAGILSIVFGVLIAAQPQSGMLSIVLILGVYAIIFGAVMLALAFRLRGAQRRLAPA
jgi:uncharacterized membrane protein HdeD (DUF308 family)